MAIYRSMTSREVKEDLLIPLNNAKEVNDDIGMAYTMMSEIGRAVGTLVPGMNLLINALSTTLSWCANQAGSKIDENIQTVQTIIQTLDNNPSYNFVGVAIETVDVHDGGEHYEVAWNIEVTGYWF